MFVVWCVLLYKDNSIKLSIGIAEIVCGCCKISFHPEPDIFDSLEVNGPSLSIFQAIQRVMVRVSLGCCLQMSHQPQRVTTFQIIIHQFKTGINQDKSHIPNYFTPVQNRDKSGQITHSNNFTPVKNKSLIISLSNSLLEH